MAQKKHKPEEIVAKLRQVGVLLSQGWLVAEAICTIGGAAFIRGDEQRDRMVAQKHAWTRTASGQAARVLHDTGMAKRHFYPDRP
jgi:hypothetical protein